MQKNKIRIYFRGELSEYLQKRTLRLRALCIVRKMLKNQSFKINICCEYSQKVLTLL